MDADAELTKQQLALSEIATAMLFSRCSYAKWKGRRMTSARLLVASSTDSPAIADVLYHLKQLVTESAPNVSVKQTTALGDLSVGQVIDDPQTALKKLTPTLLTTTEEVVLIEGLRSAPIPSFDTFTWNLQVAANSGAAVIAVIDAAGFSDEILASEIQVVRRRARENHATLAGIVVTGTASLPLPPTNAGEAEAPIVSTPLSTSNIQDFLATPVEVMPPLRFRSNLLARAAANQQRIVLPETSDDRVLLAAAQLLEAQVANIVLLGEAAQIHAQASSLGIDLTAATIVSLQNPELLEKYATKLAEVRAKKGMTLEQAREIVKDETYFATMMVFMGDADGLVSGAIHTTADTLRPALQIIKTKPGVALVSSSFLMLLADRVVVMGDCAVNIDPTAAELAEIAVESATTAAQFGLDPKVALLSYSTLGSGKGPSAELVTEATKLTQEKAPALAIDGPLQFDAAVAPSVASQKAPNSPVAGQANVLVVPNLNAGNIGYKAIQRTSGAVAVGPILQGLARPVNDLSRGATVEDIVNTVAITAVQAQQ